MADYVIEVRMYERMGPNGDRDTERRPYKDYEIWLIRSSKQLEPAQELKIAAINGYDSQYTCIRNKDQVVAEVNDIAISYSRFFITEIRKVIMHEKKIENVVYVKGTSMPWVEKHYLLKQTDDSWEQFE